MNHLQMAAALHTLGYWPDATSSAHDPDYQSAVKSFQRGQGISADGVAGPITHSRILPILSKLSEAPHPDFTSCRPWKLTRYYVAKLRPGSVPLRDEVGNLIMMVSASSFASAALEGTARDNKGRLIEVARGYHKWSSAYDPVYAYADHKRRDYISTGRSGWAGIRMSAGNPVGARRFKVETGSGLGAGYGRGSSGKSIVPGLTVAADNGRMFRHDALFRGRGGPCPAGTRVWVAELAGLLWAGEPHSGWVTVTDTGGGIAGPHFDVFVGGSKVWLGLPGRGHIWWPGMDARLPEGYGKL